MTYVLKVWINPNDPAHSVVIDATVEACSLADAKTKVQTMLGIEPEREVIQL